MTVAHYANLVHCYPREGDTRTVVLRFWDEQKARPLAPSVQLSTQALEFHFHWEEQTDEVLNNRTAARGFWGRVEDEILEQFVVDLAILQSAYMVPAVCEVLRYSEPSVGAFCESPPDEGQLSENLSAHQFGDATSDLALRWCLEHANEVSNLLAKASQWIANSGANEILADTMAAALVRSAARSLNVSPASFRRIVEHDEIGSRVILFDDYEGGSGNARRLSEVWRDHSDLGESIARELSCPASEVDSAIALAFAGEFSVETLGMFAVNNSWPSNWVLPADGDVRTRALERLRGLLQSPELAAFNLFAYGEWLRLVDGLGAEPTHLRFYQQVRRTQALDTRAEHLRLRFTQNEEEGVTELSARVRELMPLCSGACPECLASDRYDRRHYVDRNVLRAYLTGANA